MKFFVLFILAGVAMASQTTSLFSPFPQTGTAIRGKIKSITPPSAGKLHIEKIWGTSTIQIYKASKAGTMISDLPIKVGQDLEVQLRERATFDEDGNGLVVQRIENELSPSTIKVGLDVIYLPNEMTYFEPTPKLIKELDRTRSGKK